MKQLIDWKFAGALIGCAKRKPEICLCRCSVSIAWVSWMILWGQSTKSAQQVQELNDVTNFKPQHCFKVRKPLIHLNTYFDWRVRSEGVCSGCASHRAWLYLFWAPQEGSCVGWSVGLHPISTLPLCCVWFVCAHLFSPAAASAFFKSPAR